MASTHPSASPPPSLLGKALGSRTFAARRARGASLGSFRDPIPQTPCFATVFAGPWGRELSAKPTEGVHVPNDLFKWAISRTELESIVHPHPTATPYSLLYAVLLPSSDKRMTPPSRREALYDSKSRLATFDRIGQSRTPVPTSLRRTFVQPRKER